MTFFEGLNYTLANEDTSVELAIMPERSGHACALAGSGARVLPLLSTFPARLTILDISPVQLWLCELRLAALKTLDHPGFLGFLGYPLPSPHSDSVMSGRERKKIFENLRLSTECRDYFRHLYDSQGWESFLYAGKWEQTFRKLSRINRMITGKAGAGIFDSRSLEAQRKYMENRILQWKIQLSLLLLGNAAVFNALLYRGHFPKKNIPDTHYSFYTKVFRKLFNTGLARENYFLQLMFLGKLTFPEGLPIECRKAIFEKAKTGLSNTIVSYRAGDAIQEISQLDQPVDFVSLSDAPSYFKGELEQQFLQRIAPRVAAGGRVVIRNYLHIPQGLDLRGYRSITDQFRPIIDAEKVGVYVTEAYERESV